MDNKNLVHSLYLNKLQTAVIYEGCARNIKPFSETLFNLFFAFSRQDMQQALLIHGMMVELDKQNFFGSDAPVKVWRINGIGDQKKGEEEKEQSVTSLVAEWSKSLRECELYTIKIIDDITSESSRLMDMSQEFLNFSDLRVISEERINVIMDVKSMSDKQLIFSRPEQNTQWKCLYCGFIMTGATAPETCHCCSRPMSYMEKGNWFIG